MKPNTGGKYLAKERMGSAPETASIPPTPSIMNEMQIEWWPIDRPKPYPKNARKWTAKAVDKVALSIKEFGWRQPIVCDQHDVIVMGHLRLASAHHLHLTEIPVHIADLSPEKIRALRLMDNRSHDEAKWDEGLLREELLDLRGFDLDLTLSGFDSRELDAFTLEVSDKADEVPEVPEAACTKLGDLWLMGEHRLLCGDSTSVDAVERLCGGRLVNLVFTSPPYDQQRKYKGDAFNWVDLMQGVFSILPVTEAAQVLVNLGLVHRDGEWQPYWEPWIEYMQAAGWRRFAWYVWDQGPGLPGDWNGRLAPSHEFVFHFNRVSQRARKTTDCKWAGTENHGKGLRAKNGSVTEYSDAGKSVQEKKIADSVFRVMRHKARGIECQHPAVFPVELCRQVLESFSDNGNAVYEPFSGSGSQIIACEEASRTCLGMEVAPAYADISVQRWQNFTGREATLDGNGCTFAQAKEGRLREWEDNLKEECLERLDARAT